MWSYPHHDIVWCASVIRINAFHFNLWTFECFVCFLWSETKMSWLIVSLSKSNPFFLWNQHFICIHLFYVGLIKNLPSIRRPGFDPWVRKIPWRRERLPIPVFWPREFHGQYSPWGCKESDTIEQLSLSLSCGSDGKESACDTGDPSSIPGLGQPPGEGNGNPI